MLGAVDQAVGQADVVRAVELEAASGLGVDIVVGEDAVGRDLVADGGVALDVDAGPRVEGDQVAGGSGGPADEVVAGAAEDLNAEIVG